MQGEGDTDKNAKFTLTQKKANYRPKEKYALTFPPNAGEGGEGDTNKNARFTFTQNKANSPQQIKHSHDTYKLRKYLSILDT